MSAKMSLALGFLMSVVLAGQVPAAAGSPALSLDPITGPPTTQTDVVGTGFTPAEVVDLAFGAKARGSVSTDENGAFSATIRIPRAATAGPHDVTATGETSALVAIATFTVVLPSISLGRTIGPPRVDVVVTGTGFPSLERVEVAFDGTTLVEAVADASGALATTVRVPQPAASGQHDVTATGEASGLTARAVFTVRIDRWSQYGFNAGHSGWNPRESVLDASNVADLTSAWTVTVEPGGGLATGFSSPAVVKGVVYIGTERGKVFAIDAWTGAIEWSKDTGDTHNWSSPAVANGVVYIGGLGFYALRASTGDVLWKVSTGADVWSPTVAGGVVYGLSRTGTLTSKGGKFYALRASDGSILWTKKTGYPGDSSTAQAPTVADGLVYIGSASNELRAFDADTGEMRWAFSLEEEAGVAPAVVDGVAYAPSIGHLRALDATTGDVIWTAAVEGGMSSPAVANGIVFVGGSQGLHAFDAATGAPLWSAPVGYATGSSPAVANGVVYALGQTGDTETAGHLFAVDALTGEILWTVPLGSSSQPDPRVLNGMVFSGSENGQVYAFALP